MAWTIAPLKSGFRTGLDTFCLKGKDPSKLVFMAQTQQEIMPGATRLLTSLAFARQWSHATPIHADNLVVNLGQPHNT